MYRVYLFLTKEGLPIGYGALRLQDGQLYVTECVGPEHRGKGYGKAILAALISIARQDGRDLVAEIWRANSLSVRLHEGTGFQLIENSIKDGQELSTYLFRARTQG